MAEQFVHLVRVSGSALEFGRYVHVGAVTMRSWRVYRGWATSTVATFDGDPSAEPAMVFSNSFGNLCLWNGSYWLQSDEMRFMWLAAALLRLSINLLSWLYVAEKWFCKWGWFGKWGGLCMMMPLVLALGVLVVMLRSLSFEFEQSLSNVARG